MTDFYWRDAYLGNLGRGSPPESLQRKVDPGASEGPAAPSAEDVAAAEKTISAELTARLSLGFRRLFDIGVQAVFSRFRTGFLRCRHHGPGSKNLRRCRECRERFTRSLFVRGPLIRAMVAERDIRATSLQRVPYSCYLGMK